MIILKQVIRYPDTNSVEATWVDENDNEVRCHSYADVQMDLLEADLGADLPSHAALIATTRANIKPPPPPVLAEVKAAKLSEFDVARASAERVNVTVSGKQYSASESFQAQVSRQINQLGRGKPLSGATTAWRTALAEPVTMTAALLGLIEDAITAQRTAAWERYWLRFDSVQAATTVAAVNLIVW